MRTPRPSLWPVRYSHPEPVMVGTSGVQCSTSPPGFSTAPKGTWCCPEGLGVSAQLRSPGLCPLTHMQTGMWVIGGRS